MKLLAYAYDMHTYFLLYSAKPLFFDTLVFHFLYPPFRTRKLRGGLTYIHLDRLG